jgi:hypothetical protein
MSTATLTRTSKRTPMRPSRKQSLAAGLFYVITFCSIPTLGLYVNVRADGFIGGAGPDAPVYIGGILEMIVALTGIGTAIALFPVVKKQNESLAISFVATRTLEAAGILVGVASLLTIVSLRQADVGADAVVTGQALSDMYARVFSLSQSTMPAFNALALGLLLYRSRLVPRFLPTLGLIGAPLLLGTTGLALCGVIGSPSAALLLGAVPIAVWEFSLGVYLLVKGFKPSPITDEFDAEVAAKKAAYSR